MTGLDSYLRYWRTTVVRDREITEGIVRPEHRGPSPDLARALARWNGIHYFADDAARERLVLIRPLAPPPVERWWLHGLLFLVTLVTVWMAGAFFAGIPTHSVPIWSGSWDTTGVAVLEWTERSLKGLPFALALMAVLLTHEMGHYFTAKRYGINASPPYFIPAPIEINFIGTFGAFIRLRSPVVDRRQLMDVGAAGPWAGFAVALLMLVVGLARSHIVPPGFGGNAPMVVYTPIFEVQLGDSILTHVLRLTIVGPGTVMLHPLAFAGWIGLFVTALNLLPITQLDGGHVLYALVGRAQQYLGWIVWTGLLVLGVRWHLWWAWAGLLFIFSGGRLAHPRVLEPQRAVPASRVPIGLLSIALFVLTFAPVPLTLVGR